MIEEIKAGTMVWVSYSNSANWEREPREFTGIRRPVDDRFMCWDRDRLSVNDWGDIISSNPHAPKVTEWKPEGYCLWKTITDPGVTELTMYHSPGTGHGTVRPDRMGNDFHSFAVKNGLGEVQLIKTPNWFTKVGTTFMTLIFEEGCIDAEIIGAVMRKEKA
jgi:hypothetical protein